MYFNSGVFSFLIFLEGFQCIVKLSWHSLYICGTLKQRYGIPFWGWGKNLYVTVSGNICLSLIFLPLFLSLNIVQLCQGTTYVYDSFFRPYVAKHETEIDRNLLELRTRAGDIAVLYWQRAASYGQTRIYEILQYVAAQSTPRPRPPQVVYKRYDIRFVLLLFSLNLC